MKENKVLYKTLKLIYSPLLKMLYRPQAYGIENIPKDGAIIFAGNHRHAFDPVVVMTHTKRIVHYMAKESIFKGKKSKADGLSSFQALATAIAAQVGTGNIVGASGAILAGGPGAIFWMWVIAFLGMATNYAEAVLAQKTRQVDGEHISGGPVYYIKHAFRGKFGKALA